MSLVIIEAGTLGEEPRERMFAADKINAALVEQVLGEKRTEVFTNIRAFAAAATRSIEGC